MDITSIWDHGINPVIGAFAAGIVGLITTTAQRKLQSRAERKYQSKLVELELRRIQRNLIVCMKLQHNPPEGYPAERLEVNAVFDTNVLKNAAPFLGYLPDDTKLKLHKLTWDLTVLNEQMNTAKQASIAGNFEYRDTNLKAWWGTFNQHVEGLQADVSDIMKELKM